MSSNLRLGRSKPTGESHGASAGGGGRVMSVGSALVDIIVEIRKPALSTTSMTATIWIPFQRKPLWSLATVAMAAGIIPAHRIRNHSDRRHAGMN